jgi:DNA-binding NtrC family response regulator
MTIELPPLRRRPEDVPALIDRLLYELRGRAAPAISPAACAAIQRHPWPGNLRELRNALERATIVARGQTIEVGHLPVEVRQLEAPREGDDSLASIEKRHIEEVLARVGGSRSQAAQILGINRSTLRRKLNDD